ncbi:MAG: hypothetical protein J6C42_13910 [Clostridia bacterium]|nr:hypothetical protein [Clostridia bacterium]
MKRITSLLLILAMLASMTACGEQAAENTQDEVTPAAAETPETQPEETEPERIKPDIPDTTYDGQKFRFLSREVTDAIVRYYSEISASEMNGEIMNDAIFERTERMETTYDIDIVDETAGDVSATYSNSYLAGEQNWDVVIPGFSAALGLAQNGYNADWKQIEHLDLEKPWWDKSAAKSMEIGGSVYSVIGSMNTWTDSHTYAIVFNKEMAVDFEVNPYEMVRGNTWTLDNFSAILEKIGHDLDGNGELDHNDRYGAVGENFNFPLFVLASDVLLVTPDEEGYPTLNITEKFYTVADKVCSILCSSSYMRAETLRDKVDDIWGTGLRGNFRAGNSLFYVGGIEQLLIFRDLDTDIGLLPMPKYEEAQENYHHSFSTYWASIMVIPRNSSTTDFTGHMLEAMNADSYYTTSVAYYDVVLAGKAMRDKDSCEMLDIIRASRTIDPELAYNFLGVTSIYNAALDSGSADALASSVQRSQKPATKLIERFVEQYQ